MRAPATRLPNILRLTGFKSGVVIESTASVIDTERTCSSVWGRWHTTGLDGSSWVVCHRLDRRSRGTALFLCLRHPPVMEPGAGIVLCRPTLRRDAHRRRALTNFHRSFVNKQCTRDQHKLIRFGVEMPKVTPSNNKQIRWKCHLRPILRATVYQIIRNGSEHRCWSLNRNLWTMLHFRGY